MPRAASSLTSFAMGRTSAVGLVMWSSSARRVFGVTLASTAATTSSGDVSGNGTTATLTFAPKRAAT
jgi:hypothetical protein